MEAPLTCCLLAAVLSCGTLPPGVQAGPSDCAPAACARVLAFYGRHAEQAELAPRFAVRTGWGTMPRQLFAVAAELARENGLHFERQLYREQVDEPDLTPERLRALADVRPGQGRIRTLRDFRAFLATEAAGGVPIFQGVTLGIIPEKDLPPRVCGGHLRILVGIDTDRDEVLYSDTWAGSDGVKRMPLVDAWAMTDFLFTFSTSPLLHGYTLVVSESRSFESKSKSRIFYFHTYTSTQLKSFQLRTSTSTSTSNFDS